MFSGFTCQEKISRFGITTTLLVSTRTKSFDLFSFNEPQDHILQEPDEHLPMASRKAEVSGRGEKPLA
jgi:hypothetical protein